MKKNNKKNIKKNKKTDHIVITVLGCVIIFLVVLLIILNDTYFNTRDFVIDYLRFQASDYVKDEKDNTVINREDNSCHILLSSKITKSNDLSNLGALEKINNHEWVKQEFENGETWMSYYKNSFYIVQMYGADKKIYENSCKDDFEKIKKTFSFIKSE